MYFREGGIPNRVLKSSGVENCDSGLPLLGRVVQSTIKLIQD